MVLRSRALVLTCSVLLALCPIAAHASHHGAGGGQDRAGVFSTINITEDHPANDVACVFCTVNIDGDVHGDLAVVFGTVNVTGSRTISGDVATIFSTARFSEGDRIHGDLASVFSTIDSSSSLSVGGDRSLVGSGFGLTILFAPLLLLAGLIWLIVFLVRENRSRRYGAFAPAPRRF